MDADSESTELSEGAGAFPMGPLIRRVPVPTRSAAPTLEAALGPLLTRATPSAPRTEPFPEAMEPRGDELPWSTSWPERAVDPAPASTGAHDVGAELDEAVAAWTEGPVSIPLVDAEPEDAHEPAVASDPVPPRMQAEPAAAGEVAPDDSRQRAEEIAERLEAIARSLREHGATGPLMEQRGDPLGALIAGYLLGFSEVGGAGPNG